MKENEAIEIIENFPKWNLDDLWLKNDKMCELVEVAIKALEEVQQYRQIGTVEECRDAVNKQKGQYPKILYFGPRVVEYECPNCEREIDNDNNKLYCPWCGQRLK